MGYLCANFSLPRPLCSRVRSNVRDRRQTKASLNASTLWGGGIIIVIKPICIAPQCLDRQTYIHTDRQTYVGLNTDTVLGGDSKEGDKVDGAGLSKRFFLNLGFSFLKISKNPSCRFLGFSKKPKTLKSKVRILVFL